MMRGLVLILLAISRAFAHMGITFPEPRNGGRASWDLDSLRYPNPTEGICHGLNNPESPKATLVAGQSFTIQMGFGAAHDGGYCAAIIQYGNTFRKIAETKDCTLQGSMSFAVSPNIMNCDRCTLIWGWTPAASGACEVYTVCTDVRIIGGNGNMDEPNFPTIWQGKTTASIAYDNCQRVDSRKCTPNFGPYIPGSFCSGSPTPNTHVATTTAAHPVTTPTGSASGTCGGGNRGNGICPQAGQCCSQFGWCGTSAAYCTGSGTGGAGGTCGNGNRGNGRCPIAGQCCSQWGWCGTNAAYCTTSTQGYAALAEGTVAPFFSQAYVDGSDIVLALHSFAPNTYIYSSAGAGEWISGCSSSVEWTNCTYRDVAAKYGEQDYFLAIAYDKARGYSQWSQPLWANKPL
eukprot:Colp12_sorted_trinity150504_noHs@15598